MRKLQQRAGRALAGLLVAFGFGGSAHAASFTFSGVTFVQESTPDQLGLLGNGANLGGAQFSAGTVTTITGSVAFVAQSIGGGGVITPQPGFDPALSLGRQGFAQQGLAQPAGGNCHYACAINMPNGNNGTTVRHGISVGWSGGRTLGNGGGGDFVIYESGSPNVAEGFMVRVRNAATGQFSAWRFEANDGFELYLQSTAEGAFATVFDLSDFGLGAGDAVDLIEIANLISADRVANVAAGTVFFDGVSGVGNPFTSGNLDPDPLYVGVLRALNATEVDAPSALASVAAGLAMLAMVRRSRRHRPAA